MRTRLAKLELSNEAVWEKEDRRIAQPDWGANTAPWPIRAAYLALCVVLDRIYDRRPIQRFWFLEARLRSLFMAPVAGHADLLPLPLPACAECAACKCCA